MQSIEELLVAQPVGQLKPPGRRINANEEHIEERMDIAPQQEAVVGALEKRVASRNARCPGRSFTKRFRRAATASSNADP